MFLKSLSRVRDNIFIAASLNHLLCKGQYGFRMGYLIGHVLIPKGQIQKISETSTVAYFRILMNLSQFFSKAMIPILLQKVYSYIFIENIYSNLKAL